MRERLATTLEGRSVWASGFAPPGGCAMFWEPDGVLASPRCDESAAVGSRNCPPPCTRADGSFREYRVTQRERSWSRAVPTLPDWAIQVLQVVTILRARAAGQRDHRAGRGDHPAAPGAADPAALLRHLQAAAARRRCCPRPRGPVFRAAPYVSFAAYATIPLLIPALTTFGAAARVHGGLLRRRADPGAGELRRLGRGGRQRQPVRAARLEPPAVVRRVQRADRDLRDVRAGADDPHRSAVRVRGDDPLGDGRSRAAQSPADDRGVLHARAERDGPHPGREPRRHARVRTDRGGSRRRALGPGPRVPALGLERQAAAAVHDPHERARRAVGDGLERSPRRGARRRSVCCSARRSASAPRWS